ncbi:MAG: hypothetical protein ABIT23_08470, partial [Nitrosospira sp.]
PDGISSASGLTYVSFEKSKIDSEVSMKTLSQLFSIISLLAGGSVVANNGYAALLGNFTARRVIHPPPSSRQ